MHFQPLFLCVLLLHFCVDSSWPCQCHPHHKFLKMLQQEAKRGFLHSSNYRSIHLHSFWNHDLNLLTSSLCHALKVAHDFFTSYSLIHFIPSSSFINIPSASNTDLFLCHFIFFLFDQTSVFGAPHASCWCSARVPAFSHNTSHALSFGAQSFPRSVMAYHAKIWKNVVLTYADDFNPSGIVIGSTTNANNPTHPHKRGRRCTHGYSP